MRLQHQWLLSAILVLFLVPDVNALVSSDNKRPRLTVSGVAGVNVARLKNNPIITPRSSKSLGDNINGPSVIRVPSWIKSPLGKYYMYFADHRGTYIRLAYADAIEGPWTVYEPGTLSLTQAKAFTHHIASPDVHVDHESRKIRMYFHGREKKFRTQKKKQVSGIAESSDGLNFEVSKEIIGETYVRAWQWNKRWFALTKKSLYQSEDGLTKFIRLDQIDEFINRMRHSAVLVRGDYLLVFYSRMGDAPEQLLLATVDLRPDWREWEASTAVPVLKPEMPYEGANLPLTASKKGPARQAENQLRDPYVFDDNGRLYLFYSVAGESGIAMARLEIEMKMAEHSLTH